MKKQLLFIAGALLVTSALNAQITLNQAGYTSSPIGTDSLKVTTAASTFPSFVPATNATWDLTTITDSSAVLFDYQVAVPTGTPAFADSNNYTFGTYAYKGNVQSAIIPTGIIDSAIHIIGATYNLPTATTDSIYILTQDVSYSASHKRIGFPATINSFWVSSYQSNINFDLTVALATYSLAPGVIRSYVTEFDTVIGWGQMKIKTVAGTASGYMNVLQVRTMTTTLDSFFVNGLPASPTLLSALSLTQGQVVNTYAQNFYRVNEITPLAMVAFSDNANTTPTKATTHVQRLASPAGVANVLNDANVKIYPNPVTSHVISIDVPAANGEWKYELVNISGQTVAADMLSLSNSQTHTQVQLSATLTPGIYYIRLINDGRQVVVKPLEIN